jgi:hypothetical protein
MPTAGHKTLHCDLHEYAIQGYPLMVLMIISKRCIVIVVLIAHHDHLDGSIQMSGSRKRTKDIWNIWRDLEESLE